jgi:uncharacterized protein (DUF1501 family)
LSESKAATTDSNTVVLFTDPAYYQLRPSIAIKPEEVGSICIGTSPVPQAFVALMQQGQVGVVGGLHPEPNLSVSLDRNLANRIEPLNTCRLAARGMQAGFPPRALQHYGRGADQSSSLAHWLGHAPSA